MLVNLLKYLFNYQLSSPFGRKQEFYQWAQLQVNQKQIHSQWFAMDATIAGPYEAGLATLDPGFILSEDTKSFIHQIGHIALQENIRVFHELIHTGTYNGHHSGIPLDKALLLNEQSKIEDYMGSLLQGDILKYTRQFNAGLRLFKTVKTQQHYLNIAGTLLEHDIDFRNLQHRLIIGQVLMYQKHQVPIDHHTRSIILQDTLSDANRYHSDRPSSTTACPNT